MRPAEPSLRSARPQQLDGCRAVAYLQPVHEQARVTAHGDLGDQQPGGDLARRALLAEQLQDLPLAARQLDGAVARPERAAPALPEAQLVDQARNQLARHGRLAVDDA